MKMKRQSLSVIIPYRETDPAKREVLARMVNSIAGQYDELVIVKEEWDNLAAKINLGLRRAKGDWLVVANDDLELTRGTLADLCVDRAVTCPLINGGVFKLFHGHCWCFHRHTYANIGPLYEGYHKFYYDDSDYWMTIDSKGYPIHTVEAVDFNHREPGRTLKFLGGDEAMATNRDIFISRWGADALRKVGA